MSHRLARRVRRRMFAVSLKGVGLIGGTMGYSRREALELFDDIDRARAATAKAPKVEATKPPRELCADQIDKLYPTDLPLTWDACDFSLVDNFNGRTGRAALNLVHERRRKVATESAAKHAESPWRSTALSPKVPERVEVNGSPPAAKYGPDVLPSDLEQTALARADEALAHHRAKQEKE